MNSANEPFNRESEGFRRYARPMHAKRKRTAKEGQGF